jgi:hypothetical protein
MLRAPVAEFGALRNLRDGQVAVAEIATILLSQSNRRRLDAAAHAEP